MEVVVEFPYGRLRIRTSEGVLASRTGPQWDKQFSSLVASIAPRVADLHAGFAGGSGGRSELVGGEGAGGVFPPGCACRDRFPSGFCWNNHSDVKFADGFSEDVVVSGVKSSGEGGYSRVLSATPSLGSGSDLGCGVAEGEQCDDNGRTRVSTQGVTGVKTSFEPEGFGMDTKHGVSKGAGGLSTDVHDKVSEEAGLKDGFVVFGPITKKQANQLQREKKKVRKARRKMEQGKGASQVPEWRRGAAPLSAHKSSFVGCDQAVRERLAVTRAERYMAENLLATKKAQQALQLAESTDMEQVAKCQRVKLVKMTEQSMVAIEKAHGTLVATGNVPGYAETLVSSVLSSSSGGSITPNSSVSMGEVRVLAKAHEDLIAEVKEIKEENARLSRILDSAGIDPKLAKPDKEFWTVNSDGEFVDKEAVDYNFPDGYAMETASEPDRDGKTRYRIVF